MGKYLLQKGLMYNGEELGVGTVVELDDKDLVERLLSRGTIVEAGEGVEVTPRLSAFEAAQKETAERDAVRLKAHNEQQAREAEVRAEEEAKRNASSETQAADQGATATPAPLEGDSDSNSETPQPVTPVSEPPVPNQPEETQTQEQAQVNPTQAEIEETLRASGLDSTSSEEVQIS